jgi:CheY-like chemotaxis protein
MELGLSTRRDAGASTGASGSLASSASSTVASSTVASSTVASTDASSPAASTSSAASTSFGPVAVAADASVVLPGTNRRVLVCDDSDQIRHLIRVNLELEGYEVAEEFDGQAAIETLQDLTRPLPDVITLDVVMPRRDGWSMVSAIRADPRLQHIPIVMVTASAQEADRTHAQRLAVDEFVAKPFDPEDLLTKIEALSCGRVGDAGASASEL